MKRRKALYGIVAGALACALCAGIYTLAAPSWDVPQTLHYEGALTDDAGNPVTGLVTLYFRIFDAETGGTKLWEEQRGSHAMLPGGVLSVALGERNAIPSSVLEGSRWLEVQVGEDAPLTPRFKIHAVPYARRAGESARIAAGAELDDGVISGSRAADRIAALEARIASLEDTSCPKGYTHDTSRSDIVLCRKGADEVVKVGDFWVDRYESIIVDAAYWSNGQCNGTGTTYGSATDNWSTVTSFPFTGNWTAKLYSCSKTGVTPSRWMTWFQAQQALSASGKHLCTNGEWQAAAAGTPDESAKCNTGGTDVRATSVSSQCVSKWGAMEMIGNLNEWVDLWGQSGKNTDTGFASMTYYGTAGSGQGWDGFSPEVSGNGDGTWSLNGRSQGCDRNGTNCMLKNGLPFGAIRSGAWNHGGGGGVFTLALDGAPSYRHSINGFRGCMR